MEEEGKTHVVAQGESTTGLAYSAGLFWKTVWNHAKNAKLRQSRKKQNVLYPGDEIFIPAIRTKEESGGTDARHSFRRLGAPEKLSIQFTDINGDPYANEQYLLTVDGVARRGNLDGQGWLRVPIPPDARQAHIDIGEGGELASLDLGVGRLDPVDELTGVQARLSNLGYFQGEADGKMSDELEAAVRKFRLDYGLDQPPKDESQETEQESPQQEDAGDEQDDDSPAASDTQQDDDYTDEEDGQEGADGSDEEEDSDDDAKYDASDDLPGPREEDAPAYEEELAYGDEEGERDPWAEPEEDQEQPASGPSSQRDSGIDDAFRQKLREVHGI